MTNIGSSGPREPGLPLSGKRSTAKSAAAFRTISEVAQQLDVPQHVLRFWETKFTTVRPLKRGGGRRYYRPEDIVLIEQIRNLLYADGYTIKGVQRLMREGHLRLSAAPATSKRAKTVGAKNTALGTGGKGVGDRGALITELCELRDMLRRAAG